MIDEDNIRIAVVGLGYVGLPLACLFAKRYATVGFDISESRVHQLRSANDRTRMVKPEELSSLMNVNLHFSSDSNALATCNVYVIAVPTPVDDNNRPDLTPLIAASTTVGQKLKRGDVVIYESTVYPGVTEEECVPVLATCSGLEYNSDFFVGYSPERVNPGDELHKVESICKVTSGSTPATADFVDRLYSSVLTAQTHKVSSIKIAEASKIVENSQRDVNIAFANELAKIFNAMNIDTQEVLSAAATKWNFMPVKPGLVGGHCISVDPYYLIHRAEVYGVMPHIMSHARRLNESMGAYVAHQAINQMNLKGTKVKDAKVLILGFAFKENCPDTRNTKVLDIIHTLCPYTRNITVVDPVVDTQATLSRYGIEVKPAIAPESRYDLVVLAVAHSQFASLNPKDLVSADGVIYDVKGLWQKSEVDARL